MEVVSLESKRLYNFKVISNFTRIKTLLGSNLNQFCMVMSFHILTIIAPIQFGAPHIPWPEEISIQIITIRFVGIFI